jgi:putative ABC transport system permease protein
VRELKYAVRSLARTPGFTAVVLLTLALGVGANTAVFSIVHGVLLRPLPFERPQRLVSIWEYVPDDAGVYHRSRTTAGSYYQWLQEATAFEDMALFGSAGFNWTGDGEPEQLLGARVSASYFRVLGIQPLLGRAFVEEETEPGRDRVLLLGHGLWQRRFGASPDVVGKILTLDGAPYEILGVMPDGVYPTWPQATGRVPFLPLYQQIWVPMALSEERRLDRRSHLYGVLARLRDGVPLERARSEMRTIASRIDPRESAVVELYLDEVTGGARAGLLVLLVAVGLVLAVACANIASLVLARSSNRRKEAALRTALGAGPFALLRHFLAESLVLGGLGGALGTGLAFFGVDLLVKLSPAEVPRLAQSSLSLPALGFAVALSIASAMLFGLAPALQMARTDLRARMTRARARPLLVVAEVSVAVVLVVGASLMVRSFVELQRVDLGFSGSNVLLAEVMLPHSRYDEPGEIARFHDELVRRLDALPEVRSAGLTYDHPLESNWIDSFRFVGQSRQEEPFSAVLRIVSPGYFRTLGIDVVSGRAFEELDDASHPGAVIVNEAFVRRYLPDGDALGRRLAIGTPGYVWGDAVPRSFEIVGVVRNVRFLGPTEPPEPAYYLPAAQFPVTEMRVAVRTEGEPSALAGTLREEVWALDPNLPVSGITTMERLISESLAQPRFHAVVLGAFGSLGLALAALGIYGLLAHNVAERTREFGIRMALGAVARDVTHMVVKEGLRLASVGLALGLLVALLAGRALESLLFGVSASDPWTFAAAALFLGCVAAVASYLPARRALRIEPLTALRTD